jgi:hypothetical protein
MTTAMLNCLDDVEKRKALAGITSESMWRKWSELRKVFIYSRGVDLWETFVPRGAGGCVIRSHRSFADALREIK